MKSLEIISGKIEEVEFRESRGDAGDEMIWEYETIVNKEELETIKQDLEVLEILRKHLRFIGEHKTSLKLVNNGCISNDLTKVKQWLEENEE